MFVLVEQSIVKCAHGGLVDIEPSQDLVRIDGQPMLVEPDLVGRSISACPHATPSTPPCRNTIGVQDAPTHSSFVRIEGRRLCKDTTVGTTDWSKLGIVPFSVTDPGQTLVTVSE
jgi:hypothetical protein